MTNSNLVTNSGLLKLTDYEFDYLQSFLTANDRGGYYLALYNMTGSKQALLQAQISTYSEGAGGAAYTANNALRELFPTKYPFPTTDQFSKYLAQFDLDGIRAWMDDHPENARKLGLVGWC